MKYPITHLTSKDIVVNIGRQSWAVKEQNQEVVFAVPQPPPDLCNITFHYPAGDIEGYMNIILSYPSY